MAALFKKNKYAPFDDIVVAKEINEDKPSAVVYAERDAFSFRGAVFTITCIVSLCWIFSRCEKLIPSLIMWLGYLIFWAVTCRFFEVKKLAPLNLFLNVLLLASPCALFGHLLDSFTFYACFPLTLGVTVLGTCPADGRQLFEYYPIDYYIKNIFISLICAAIPEMFFGLMGNHVLSPRIMVAAIVMTSLAYLEDKMLGSHKLLSGRSLSGSAVLPKTEFDTLNIFVSGRLIYIGVSLAALAASMGASVLASTYTSLDPICVRAVAAAIVFAIWIAVTQNSKMPFESFIAILFFARSSSLVMFLVVAATDILVKGFMTVTRRKSIFHTRNKFADGIPVMLMVVGIFVMVAECCL